MITLSALQSFLGLCTLINMGILLVWFLVFSFAGEWVFGLHRERFKMTRETFDGIHYAGLAIYKLGIFLFNLVPYGALSLID